MVLCHFPHMLLAGSRTVETWGVLHMSDQMVNGASEVATLWCYRNLFIIIIFKKTSVGVPDVGDKN